MKIHTLGGYEEVGRNMTAVEVDGEAVIFDMGYEMEEVINADGEVNEMTTNQTLETGAIPKDEVLYESDADVRAIVIGHGHMDHVGAIPKLAGAYDCPILCTPYTKKIVDKQIEDDRKNIQNPVIAVEKGDEYEISDALDLEFIHVNHSIPQATLSWLKTPEGGVIYGNDMKIDRSPVIEETTDIEKMRTAGEEGIELMIPGTTRVEDEGRCRSEESVEVELRDVLDSCYDAGGAVILSTFSSQISRLNTVLDANDGRRKVAFVGRSLREYTEAAEDLGLIDLSDVEVVSYFDECEEVMDKVEGAREEWLVVATGNQGEPGAQMDKIASQTYPFKFREGDHVIFSSQVIPTPLTQANRYSLEKKMKSQGVRLYKDVHTSGHAKKEDHRDFIQMLDPSNIVPSHGTVQKLGSYVELAREEGYTLEEDVFISENGRTIEIN
ncbi:MAG: ribonuclease J [Nanohaloarchaea archaeon SW_7_43_1]|nr:MAG: ribonuclease J [Nanohaloarchaea archaeon SW_7_43_1]